MLNKVTLQGRLVRDVELRQTTGGTAVASFTVAWSEKYKENERKVFLPCVAWKNNAEFVSRFFKKGSEVIVEGSLTSRKWQDKDGNNRETIELIADRVHFCGPKNGNSGANQTDGFAELPAEDDGDLPF